MKLIIEIDEEVYRARQHWVANPKRTIDKIDIAIANGTPYEPKGDLISREALKESIQRYMSDNWVMPCNEVLKRIDNAPTVEARPQGEWVRKEDVIHSIAKQYSEHNELVPIWLSIGDIKGGAE